MAANSHRAHDPVQPLDIDAVRRGLTGLYLGTPLLYFPELGSTNTLATQLAREGAAEGTLVTTDFQTAGRGRISRVWKALPGQQLALSLVLRPRFPPHFLVMASALAVGGAVEEVAGLRLRAYRDAQEPGGGAAPLVREEHDAPDAVVGIKWPNDVQVAGRKVSGILIETSDGFAVLGIGINVNGTLEGDPDLATRATTLEQAIGRPVSREALLITLLRRLDTRYAQLQTGAEAARQSLRDEWRARLVTLGTPVTIRQGERELSGQAEDVTEDGALMVRDAQGVQHVVTWGDVQSDGADAQSGVGLGSA